MRHPSLLAAALLTLVIASPATAQDTCPQVSPGFTPACALPGGTCPSLAECASGWLWMSPGHPMKIIPLAFQRESDGQVGVLHCYTDSLAGYALGKPVCPLGSPPSITLRDFCNRIRGFAVPNPIPGVTNQPPPSFSGICGASFDIPKEIGETLAEAPAWVGPGRAARLKRLSRWLYAETGASR